MLASGRIHRALVQQLCRRLELLVLQQPADQGVARILFRLRLLGVLPRQQHLRLDMDQRRGHHQEFAHDVQIQLLHHDDVIEVLLRDERDGNVVDVHLVLLNEVDQQIERSLELGDLDRVSVR
jgi:hypothetical protein